MKKILAIDDDPDILELLKEELEFLGHTVDTLEDPNLVKDSFISQDYDILLMDIIMPKKNGLELIEEISPFKNGTKFVLTSGFASLFSDDERLNLVDLVIEKPYSIKDIKRILD